MQIKSNKLYKLIHLILIKFPSLGTMISLICILIFFAVRSPYFLSIGSVINITNYASDIGIAGSMAALLFITGEFDFSLGILASFCGSLFFIFLKYSQIPVAIALVVVVGALIGLLKGVLVSIFKISSFISTLTIMLIVQGLSIMLTKTNFGGKIIATPGEHIEHYSAYRRYFAGNLKLAEVYNIGHITIFWLFLTVVVTVFLRLTKYGNWCVATGGDIEKAKGIGIPVILVKILVFTSTSTVMALFGIIQAFRDGSIQANSNLGNETIYMLVAIIGGCSLSGGVGSIVGTFLGALIFSSCYQGIVFADLNNDLFNLFLGVVILITVFINKINNKFFRNFRYS